jgi:hypothetical protein
VELVYQTQFFKGLSTGCNVSPALSQGNYLFTHSPCPLKVLSSEMNQAKSGLFRKTLIKGIGAAIFQQISRSPNPVRAL